MFEDEFEIHARDVTSVLDGIKYYVEKQNELNSELKNKMQIEKDFSRMAVAKIKELRAEVDLLKAKNRNLENDLVAKVGENAKLQSRVNQLGKMTTGVGVFSEKDLKRLCQYLHPDRTGRDTQDLFRIFKSKLDGVRND